MEQPQQKKWIGAGRFDSVNSTFKHRIYLTNGKELTGYSKGLLSNEMTDKTVLLERVILRLVKGNYLDPARVIRIEFFLNGALFKKDELIYILFPTHHSLGVNETFIKDQRLFTFFQRLYAQLKNGNLITKSLSHKPQNQEDPFNVSRKKFETDIELQAYVQQLIKAQHEEGLVFAFYYKYRSKWF